MLSINQADAPCSCECKCMKPECFRLASALKNTSPFKSSVPTAHTVEAISMHLPARDTDSVCTRTEMATCLSLLVPALGPLFSLHHFHICESALITPRSRMILATSSETEWGGWNSNLHYRFPCLLTLVYGLAKSKNVFHEMATPENQPPEYFSRGLETTALKYHTLMGINDPITQLEALALFIFNCCSFTWHALIRKTCRPSACHARRELQINCKWPFNNV